METTGINLSPQEIALMQEMMSRQTNLPQLDEKTIGIFFLVLLILAIWSLIWKGLALWRSAKNGHKGWFIFILILNTLGILEIVYLIVYRKRKVRVLTASPSETTPTINKEV
ncbi:hypothetical protein SDC9_21638 [bioreactor metagenome]|uniref:DUF5652 domain-containing protein n=1 Tax=bioreactor metagenome TaxID=1076179 RepID=A0A644UA05_9ZZZZ|nr:DUF5652 family protein [Candidatus Elulimicrobiales bacterium]